VNRAWKVGSLVASVASAVVAEPYVAVLAGVGATPRYVLLR
jgi:hypothetical protein